MTELKPGRELDALVAEKVMGEKPPEGSHYEGGGDWTTFRWIQDWACETRHWPPQYSTNISAAWEVVEKFTEAFADLDLTVEKGVWECVFDTREIVPRHFLAGADTAPHAICLAALAAVARKLPQPTNEADKT